MAEVRQMPAVNTPRPRARTAYTKRTTSPLPAKPENRSKQTDQSRLWWWLLAVVVVIEVAFEVYGPSLRGPFVFDDFSLPFYDPRRPVDQFAEWIQGVRPVLMFSYWLNYYFSDRNPYSYHVLNVLIHVANAFLVYGISSNLLARSPKGLAVRQPFAIACGLLFLLHPIQTESVAYIAGRSESLSALFCLSALALFLYKGSEKISWLRSAAVLLLFALATRTKEHTAILPLVFVLTDWLWDSGPVGALRKNRLLYLPIALGAPVALFFVWKVLSSSASAGFALKGVTWYGYFFTECGVLLTYLRLFLVPARQNIDYNLPILSAPNFMTAAGILAALGLLYVAWRWRKRQPLITYGILFFFIFLAPTSSFIPIKDALAERRLYLPIVGLILVSAGLLIEWKITGTRVFVASSVVLVLAGVLTYQRSRVWGSEVALWEDTLSKAPQDLRGYPHLIHGYVSERRCKEALLRLDGLSKQIPVDATLLTHWAFAYECVNRPDEAILKLQAAAQMAPDANIEMKIATDSLRLNHIEDALSALDRALVLDPSLDSAYVTRGDLYAQSGQIPRAVEDYRNALRINPKNTRALMQLHSLTQMGSDPKG